MIRRWLSEPSVARPMTSLLTGGFISAVGTIFSGAFIFPGAIPQPRVQQMPSFIRDPRANRRLAAADPHSRNTHFLFAALASLILSFAGPTLAADGPADTANATPDNAADQAPRVTLGWTDTPPELDGVMDEKAWLAGGLVTDLRQVLPNSGAPPSQRTEIRVLTDGDTLFIGFRCYDTNPEEIVHNRMQRDTFPYYDDRVGITLDTFDSRRNGYFFGTNPNAMRHDVLLEAENFEVSWDTIWYVETSIDSEGWTAEIAIPFSSIGFDPESDKWGINFERGIRRNDEDLRWSNHEPHNNVAAMGVAGTLEGVKNLNQGLGFELTPGLTIRRVDGQKTERFEVDPTFDGFYKILPSVTAAVTANTDFGQVESDDIQINDDRFALFFPEKRDFFLEDGLIFDFGDISQNGRPFFSRRIGFNPGGPVRIQGGGKVTGRLGPVKFGVLDTFVEHKNGIEDRNLFVGRAAMNVLGESTLGMIVTHGNPDGSRARNPSQGPALNPVTGAGGGRASTTVGADFLYRNTNFLGTGQAARASLWWAKSIESGLDGGRNNGYGIKLEYPNDRINWLLGYEELQEDYAPRLGFVNRNDIRHTFASGRYRHRPKSGPFRTIDHKFFGQIYVDSGNEIETINMRFVPVEFTTPIDDGFDFRYRFRHEDLRSAIPNFDIPRDKYTFHEVGARLFTSRNRPLRIETEVWYGSYFDGTRTRVDVNLEYRPSHYLFVEIEYEFRDINLPKAGSLLAGSPDRNDRDLQLVRLKFDLIFTPNIVWSNFVQYDNRSDSAGLNSRFRYILRDGREFFLVLNQGVVTNDNDLEFTRTETLIKGVWTFTF